MAHFLDQIKQDLMFWYFCSVNSTFIVIHFKLVSKCQIVSVKTFSSSSCNCTYNWPHCDLPCVHWHSLDLLHSDLRPLLDCLEPEREPHRDLCVLRWPSVHAWVTVQSGVDGTGVYVWKNESIHGNSFIYVILATIIGCYGSEKERYRKNKESHTAVYYCHQWWQGLYYTGGTVTLSKLGHQENMFKNMNELLKYLQEVRWFACFLLYHQ